LCLAVTFTDADNNIPGGILMKWLFTSRAASVESRHVQLLLLLLTLILFVLGGGAPTAGGGQGG
jgi:hypothetical protein